MRYLTHLGGATATILVSVVLLMFDPLRVLGVATLAANALSHVAVQVLKRTVVRTRPLDANGNPFSFPSGHAAAAFAIAVTVGLYYPLLFVPLVALALLIGASRVTLLVHHVTDVVAGAALGVAAAVTIFLIGA